MKLSHFTVVEKNIKSRSSPTIPLVLLIPAALLPGLPSFADTINTVSS